MEQHEALIDHLDKSLQGEGSPEMEQLISNDPEAAREWNYLLLAVDAIQEAGLQEQVAAVKKTWQLQQTAVMQPSGGIIRQLSRNVAKIAAILVVLGGGAAFFKYATISSGSLYDKYYSAYELNTSRGASEPDAMEKAYQEKDWNAVLADFTKVKRDNKADFLAGMADLGLKRYNDAIEHFEQVIAVNGQAGSDYFQDEAQYYLAITWLAKDKVNEALPILEKIRANKDHLFHDKVSRMSFLDLRLVQYKESK
jgi:tetratricopeptide (TPR) repeat protein